MWFACDLWRYTNFFWLIGWFFGRPFVKRFALCYRTVVCHVLSCLSVTLVYCGQTVGCITMTLGMQVGLDPGHIVLDEDPAPPQRGTTSTNFRPTSIVAKRSPISATAELLSVIVSKRDRLLSLSASCGVNNGGCDRRCDDSVDGPVCSCPAGFELDKRDRSTCHGEYLYFTVHTAKHNASWSILNT